MILNNNLTNVCIFTEALFRLPAECQTRILQNPFLTVLFINVSLINVAQTFQFAKMCHKLKVCATMHASRIRNGVSERNRND